MTNINNKYDEGKSSKSLQDDNKKDVVFNSEDGHQPNKYFEGDAILSEVERLVEHKILTNKEMEDRDIENLCSGNFLVNKIYYRMSAKKRRKKAIALAANIILANGVAIKNQINANDQNILKNKEKEPQNHIQEPSQATTQSTPSNAKSEILRISGGTLSEIITKIAEMLAGKSGANLQSGANNFGAMIEVLAMPEVEAKFADSVKILAKDPILVADINDVLRKTNSSTAFGGVVGKYLGEDEKQAINLVSAEDLNKRRAENALNAKALSNDGLFL